MLNLSWHTGAASVFSWQTVRRKRQYGGKKKGYAHRSISLFYICTPTMGEHGERFYTTPCAMIALATFMKPATFAPFT